MRAPEPPRSSFRNRVAWRVANFALNHIADERYRDSIDLLIRAGLEARADVASLRAGLAAGLRRPD